MLSVARKRLLGFGVIAFVALIVVLGVTKPNPLADERSYWAEFDTAQGLGKIDRDVRIAGVKVGRIGDVERSGDDVRIELVLFEDFTIHDDARVEMRPHTLFEGSSFVDLSPGSPSAPVIQPEDTIPIEQTSNYVTLDEALRVLRPEIRTSLRELADVGAKTLRGPAIAGVQRTLRGSPALTRALGPAARAAQGEGRVELAGAIDGMAQTTDAVASREEDLVPLVRGLEGTAAGLGVDGGAPLDAALAALPPALRELNAAAPPLTALVDRLDRLSVEITPALPDLALALAATTPVVERAIPVLRRATPLIRDTRLLATRLAAAKGGLLDYLELLPRPLAKFDRALEIVNAPTVHGAPAYRQLVAGGFTSLDAAFRGYQTEAQNPNAPGHALRVGTYVGPGAAGGVGGILGGGAPLADASDPRVADCADVRQVSVEAARQLQAAGACE